MVKENRSPSVYYPERKHHTWKSKWKEESQKRFYEHPNGKNLRKNMDTQQRSN